MPNMSYCRFQNTVRDLEDCAENIFDDDLSEEETTARRQLIELCQTILDDVRDELEEEDE